MPSKNATTVYLTDGERHALRELADREERTQSSVVGRLIRAAVAPDAVLDAAAPECQHDWVMKNGGIKKCSKCPAVKR